METALVDDDSVERLLYEFFQCAPVREEDVEMDEFFATSTYVVQEEHTTLEFSRNDDTPEVTIVITSCGRRLFHATLTLRKYHLKKGAQRTLQLETSRAGLLLLKLPGIEASLYPGQCSV